MTSANGWETTDGVAVGDVVTVTISDGSQSWVLDPVVVPPAPTSMLPMQELIWVSIAMTAGRRLVGGRTDRSSVAEARGHTDLSKVDHKEERDLAHAATTTKPSFMEKLNGPWHERALWVYLVDRHRPLGRTPLPGRPDLDPQHAAAGGARRARVPVSLARASQRSCTSPMRS